MTRTPRKRKHDHPVRIAESAGASMVEAAPSPQPVGILCPRCRFPMRVCRTKALSNAVIRERICERCGERSDTTEENDADADLRDALGKKLAQADLHTLQQAAKAILKY